MVMGFCSNDRSGDFELELLVRFFFRVGGFLNIFYRIFLRF